MKAHLTCHHPPACAALDGGPGQPRPGHIVLPLSCVPLPQDPWIYVLGFMARGPKFLTISRSNFYLALDIVHFCITIYLPICYFFLPPSTLEKKWWHVYPKTVFGWWDKGVVSWCLVGGIKGVRPFLNLLFANSLLANNSYIILTAFGPTSKMRLLLG